MSMNRLFIYPEGHGEGSFVSLQHKLAFLFEPNKEWKETDENSPQFKVILRSNGGSFEAGAAWRKKVQEGPNRGAIFYSFTVDDPSFDAPLNLTAFVLVKAPDKNSPTEYEVVWRRPNRRAA